MTSLRLIFIIAKKEAVFMEMLQQLKDIYVSYTEELAKVVKEAGPMDGLFGWGDDPRKDPCHMRFYENVEQWVGTFLAAAPVQTDVFHAVRYILETPAEYRGKSCFWFMYAAQGLTRELIPMLTPQQCAQLRGFYDEAYPRRDRMPVQKEVYKLLKKGAK